MIVRTKLGFTLDVEHAEVGDRVEVPRAFEGDDTGYTEQDARVVAYILLSGKKWSLRKLKELEIDTKSSIPEWLVFSRPKEIIAFMETAYSLKGSFLVKSNAGAGNPIARLNLPTQLMAEDLQEMWARLRVLTKITTRADATGSFLDTSGVSAYREFRNLVPLTGPHMRRMAAKADEAADNTRHAWAPMTDTVVEIVP